MSDAEDLRRLAALGADALDNDPRLQATIAGLEHTRDDQAAQLAALTALVAELQAAKPAAFQPGTYKPGPTTTGTTGKLEAHVGSIVVKDSGSLIENLDIFGRLSFAPGVKRCKTRNVRVRGIANPTAGTGAQVGVVQCTAEGIEDLEFEDMLIQPDVQHWSLNGILGHDFTSRRVRMVNTSDGFGIYPKGKSDKAVAVNVHDEGSWVSALAFFRPSNNGTDPEGTHNDGCQIQGGSDWGFRGTRFDAFIDPNVGQAKGSQYAPLLVATSAVMITPNVSPVSDGYFDRVFMDGGSTSLNVAEKSFGPIQGLDLDIWFGRGQRQGPQAFMARATKAVTDLSRLRFEDGKGTPVVQAG